MKNLALMILLFALGVGFYAYLQHRDAARRFERGEIDSALNRK